MISALIVDDEPSLLDSLTRALGLEGFTVEAARTGEAALTIATEREFDVVVLDVSMPGLDGLEVVRRMRSIGDRTPILMLTARDAIDDRVAGLEAGADDYLVKPFALRELIARLRALLRRSDPAAEPVLRFSDLMLDRKAREARRGDRTIDLSRTEFNLLELFMLHPRQVLTRTQIFESVWDYDFGPGSNSLGVYIGYLRKKTEAGGEPRLIQTARGVGYSLKES